MRGSTYSKTTNLIFSVTILYNIFNSDFTNGHCHKAAFQKKKLLETEEEETLRWTRLKRERILIYVIPDSVITNNFTFHPKIHALDRNKDTQKTWAGIQY